MSNFKKGDIVVSLIEQNTGNPTSDLLKPGDIRSVYGENCDIWFKSDGRGAYEQKNFRRASKLEIEAYRNGTTNVEYWVRKWPSGILTMGCKTDGKMFKSLEEYNNEGGVQMYGTYGHLQSGSYPQELATQEQIEYFNEHETLTTYVDVKCPINVVDKKGNLLKIGDRVTFGGGGHNASHKWYDRNHSLINGGEYIIQDIDLDRDGSGVLKLDNNAARSHYCTKVMHEFKRGGWYRTIGTQFTTNKYIKFFIFDDAKKVVFSERITQAGVHNIFNAEHNYQRSSIAHPTESLVLVPDEEVAEYINKIINSFPIY